MGDISDDEYRREQGIIMRQLKVHTSTTVMPTHLPNLERAANFLEDLPALWLHPGVIHEEREALIRQVFLQITIAGKEFVDIEPKPDTILFATMVTAQKVWYQELESSRSSDSYFCYLLASVFPESNHGCRSWPTTTVPSISIRMYERAASLA